MLSSRQNSDISDLNRTALPALATLLALSGCSKEVIKKPGQEQELTAQQALDERVSPALKRELKNYLKAVAELHSQGYPLAVTRPISLSGVDKSFVAPLREAFGQYSIASATYLAPFTNLYTYHGRFLDRPPELAANAIAELKGEGLDLGLHLFWVDGSTPGTLQVLSPRYADQAVVFELSFDHESGAETEKAQAELVKRLKVLMPPEAEWSSTLFKALPARSNWQSIFSLSSGQQIPKEEQIHLDRAFSEKLFNKIIIEALPNGETLGGVYSGHHSSIPVIGSFLSRPRRVFVIDQKDWESIRDLGYPAIAVRGDLEEISFMHQGGDFELLDHFDSRFKNFGSKRLGVDDFGNTRYSSRHTATFPPYENISFVIPPFFSARSEGKDTSRFINVPVGFTELFKEQEAFALKESFLVEPYQPVFAANGKHIFSQVEHEWLKSQFSSAFPILTSSLAEFESILGVDALPGIFISGTDQLNASMGGDSPLPIQVRFPLLAKEDSLRATIFHEAFHYYDAVFGLSEGSFKTLYAQIRAAEGGFRFLSKLNESKVFGFSNNFGHTYSNHMECAASMATALLIHPSGLQAIATDSQQEKLWLKGLTTALLDNLIKAEKLGGLKKGVQFKKLLEESLEGL